jgi:hypothetical protein
MESKFGSIHKYLCSQLACTEAGTAVVLQHNTKEKPLFRSLHSIQRWMNQTSWQASRPGLYVESWKSMDHRKSSVSSFNALANATKSPNLRLWALIPCQASSTSQRNHKSELMERARQSTYNINNQQGSGSKKNPHHNKETTTKIIAIADKCTYEICSD